MCMLQKGEACRALYKIVERQFSWIAVRNIKAFPFFPGITPGNFVSFPLPFKVLWVLPCFTRSPSFLEVVDSRQKQCACDWDV